MILEIQQYKKIYDIAINNSLSEKFKHNIIPSLLWEKKIMYFPIKTQQKCLIWFDLFGLHDLRCQ